MTETAIQTLARFGAETPRSAHPQTALLRAELAFLDTLACAVIGADAAETRSVIAAASAWGDGSVPVLGTATRLPAPWAAVANGAAAHAFDLDDYSLSANDHPSAVLVPAILAAAQAMGEDVPGVALLDAYLIGLEAIMRIGDAVNMGHYNLGWHTTSTIDSFGATSAVCRLWQLSAEQTAHALALTASMGSGYVSQFGTSGKPLHAGLAAKAGLLAAGLARNGATGYAGALDGKVSFTSLMVPPGAVGFRAAFAKLGTTWALEEFGLGAKVYPSCGYTHRVIDARRVLHQRLGVTGADQIASVAVSIPEHFRAILPFEVPADRTEALFSPAYCAAVALATGNNTLDDFTDAAVLTPDMQALTGRVTVTARSPRDRTINVDPDDPDTVTVTLTDGRTETAEVGLWTGAPGRELDRAGFETKVHACFAHIGLDAACADALIEASLSMQGATVLRDLHTAVPRRV